MRFSKKDVFCATAMHTKYCFLCPMSRKDIIRLAIKLKTPVEKTWSCHREGKVHCGRCYACKQRLKAFHSLGVKDPVFKRS